MSFAPGSLFLIEIVTGERLKWPVLHPLAHLLYFTLLLLFSESDKTKKHRFDAMPIAKQVANDIGKSCGRAARTSAKTNESIFKHLCYFHSIHMTRQTTLCLDVRRPWLGKSKRPTAESKSSLWVNTADWGKKPTASNTFSLPASALRNSWQMPCGLHKT